MSLTLPNAPVEALSLVRLHAPLLLRAMGAEISPTHPLKIAQPYPLYTFPIEAVIDDQPLDSAWLAGWQYLVVDNDQTVGLAEVAATDAERNPALAFATIVPSQCAQPIVSRIIDAQQLPDVALRSYELRILRVPSLTALAVWLRGDNDDIVLPIENVPDGVPLEETTWNGVAVVTSQAQLARLLRPIAFYRLNSHDD